MKFQTDTVVDNGDPFKSLQSELDELKLCDLTLVLDGATAEDLTKGDQTLHVAESATNEDEITLNFCQESHSNDVASDSNDEKNSEKPRLFKRHVHLHLFAAVE